MPRSQRVQLNKAPVTEVTPGSFDSGVVTTQQFDMPATEIKTPGQQLAEAVGMVAKGAATIYEGYEDERKNEEVINWSIYGDQMGREALKKASALPINEQSASLKASLEEFMGTFESYSEGRGVSKEGFQAGLGSISTYIATGEDNIMKAQIDANRKRKISGIHIQIANMSAQGKSPKTIMQYMASNKDMYLDKQSVTIDYVRTIANDINGYMVANPGIDVEALIKEKLLVKTLDGHDIYKIKEAKDIIDNLRQDNRAALSLYQQDNYKGLVEIIDKEKIRDKKYLVDHVGKVDPIQMGILQNNVEQNQRDWQNKNLDQYYKQIKSKSIGIKELDLALERKEITTSHHRTLENEYHATIAKQTAAQTHLDLTKIFISEPTQAKMYELEALQNKDGSLMYRSGEVRKAFKQVISNEYQRIAAGGFSDIQGLKSVFANAKNIVKLDAYDSTLLGLTPTVDGKATNMQELLERTDIEPAKKIFVINEYIKNVRQLNQIAKSQGYVSKNIPKFEAEAGIIQAEIALHGVHGIKSYLNNLQTAPKDRYHTTKEQTIAANIYKYDPDMTLYDDEEVEAGYLITQAPHVASIYDLVYNQTGNERMAAEVTRQYMFDHMTKVDVEGSGLQDDHIWVYDGTGINSQETYNRVTEVLGEAFGIEDDLQLYNTDPTNPNNPMWLFKNLNSQKWIEIQGDMIKDIVNESSGDYQHIFNKYGYK